MKDAVFAVAVQCNVGTDDEIDGSLRALLFPSSHISLHLSCEGGRHRAAKSSPTTPLLILDRRSSDPRSECLHVPESDPRLLFDPHGACDLPLPFLRYSRTCIGRPMDYLLENRTTLIFSTTAITATPDPKRTTDPRLGRSVWHQHRQRQR